MGNDIKKGASKKLTVSEENLGELKGGVKGCQKTASGCVNDNSSKCVCKPGDGTGPAGTGRAVHL
ncbi:MAG: hypothetical protein U0174_28535 [Polyangiaceae bacterium]